MRCTAGANSLTTSATAALICCCIVTAIGKYMAGLTFRIARSATFRRPDPVGFPLPRPSAAPRSLSTTSSGSLDLRYAWLRVREARHHGWIMPGDDEPRIGGQLLHAVLGAQVRFGIEGLGDRRVLVQVLVKVHVVAGQYHDALRRADAEILRRVCVLSDRKSVWYSK